MEGKEDIDWFAPIVADAEAGFGGQLNVFELMKSMIEAGAAEFTLKTSCRLRKSAGIWAEKCCFRRKRRYVI